MRFGPREESVKERCTNIYKKEKRMAKITTYPNKTEQFEMNMNQDLSEKRKFFWMEVNKSKEWKVRKFE